MNKAEYRRKKRHRENAKVRNKKSVRPHSRIGGRTGSIWKKKTHPKRHARMRLVILNAPTAPQFGMATLNVTSPLETEGRTAIQRIAVASVAMPPHSPVDNNSVSKICGTCRKREPESGYCIMWCRPTESNGTCSQWAAIEED